YTQPLKNPDQPTKEMRVPWIRMQGLWLQQAGFVINAPVTVRVMEGCVVLTLET
ncbi:MAG TPA: type I toxin-antitoxin system SymE family toxin, partial [Gammaproteobacteria bacterium]|nr:type I toxin-antitoxin system SymE family toxin [Gammaproteobacteria bacterium]